MVESSFIVRYAANKTGSELILPDQTLVVSKTLNDHKTLQVLVWNIFKQKRADWQSILARFAKSQLVLLQEAHTSTALLDYVTHNNLIADHVPAFSINDKDAGVMTLAKTLPLQAWGFKIKEPLIRFPKSVLVTIYPLAHTSKTLLVANIHAINFSLGIKQYHKQLKSLLERIHLHAGPVILAGDFNAWSRKRFELLYQLTKELELCPVNFILDKRTTFLGRPLDYIFYRGLGITDSRIIKTNASDHNPLFVTFSY